jgi:Tol biopolymer transport system component
VRFTVQDRVSTRDLDLGPRSGTNTTSELWEVSIAGTNLHPLFPGWHTPTDECCGKWTADGRYFVFQSQGQIWSLRENNGFLQQASRTPVQLTTGPMTLSAPVPSKDGKRLFVVGAIVRGELVRCELKSGQLLPFLSGLSAQDVSFSRDGQWVSYVLYPEGTLWRSKLDGSQRLQLSYPPLYASMPSWSPDGKQIAFSDISTGKTERIYLVSPESGGPQQLVPNDAESQIDPGWWPDGGKILFSSIPPYTTSIRVLDLKSHQISALPGSEGLFSPRLSPDGRYVAALTSDSLSIRLFDFVGQKWLELFKGSAAYPSWSRNGQYIYFLHWPDDPSVLKVRIRDGRVDRVVDLNNFRMTGYFDFWMGLASDDSPLLLRDTGTQEIYALDWQAP